MVLACSKATVRWMREQMWATGLNILRLCSKKKKGGFSNFGLMEELWDGGLKLNECDACIVTTTFLWIRVLIGIFGSRYLTDQLVKVQIVNEVNKVNRSAFCLVFSIMDIVLVSLEFISFCSLVLCLFSKDFVIEAIRSIAELITYGDQHEDSTFFEWDF